MPLKVAFLVCHLRWTCSSSFPGLIFLLTIDFPQVQCRLLKSQIQIQSHSF